MKKLSFALVIAFLALVLFPSCDKDTPNESVSWLDGKTFTVKQKESDEDMILLTLTFSAGKANLSIVMTEHHDDGSFDVEEASCITTYTYDKPILKFAPAYAYSTRIAYTKDGQSNVKSKDVKSDSDQDIANLRGVVTEADESIRISSVNPNYPEVLIFKIKK